MNNNNDNFEGEEKKGANKVEGNDDNFEGEKKGENKVKGKETINLEDGIKVEFEGYYNKNEPYNGEIKKYDKDNNLIMQGGFLCLAGHPTYDERNYNGEITEYKNSKMLHKGTYRYEDVGLVIPEGKHVYYHDNGEVKRIETYNKNGKLHGDVTAYNDDGNIEFSGTFANGAGHGTYYHSNGNVKREETYNKYGELDGVVKTYNDAGILEFSGTFTNGEGNGTYYYTDLQNIRHTLYEGDVGLSEGFLTGFDCWATPMHDIYPHGNGNVYDLNDHLRYEGRYLNGERNGLVKKYNDNGNLISEGEYKDDWLHGSVMEYNDNGNLIFEGEYVKGLLNGRAKKYNDNGKLIFEGEYKYGFGNGKEYDANGNLIFKGQFVYDLKSGEGKEYHDNGRLKFDGEYKDGKRDGYGKEYDNNGNGIFEGIYKDGKRNGYGKEYNNNGKVIFEGYYANEGKPYNGVKYQYNSKGELIKKETIKNGEVERQNNNNIINENKINLEDRKGGKGSGEKSNDCNIF